jgi:exosortase
LLFLPTRLIQEANPEWRLVSWLLAIEVVGLTLLFVRFALGPSRLAHLAFPVCFFLVAVPWPTVIEGPLIQGLTRANAATVVEALGWLGIPALQRGNVIEVGTGMVGIDEACSGIRSFQSSLMISLFLGELYRLNVSRRVVLCLAGFILAFLFNVGRTFLLVDVAATKGIAAISRWHDPAGVSIMVACLVGLLLCALALRVGDRRWKMEARDYRTTGLQDNGTTGQRTTGLRDHGTMGLQDHASRRLACALLVWLVFVEGGVELWYRIHEWGLPKSTGWTVAWPQDNPTFKELKLPEKARQLLRYDHAFNATWRENDAAWQMIFLRWQPGRIAAHLAKSHTPDVCLTAAGKKLVSQSDLKWFSVHGLELPFRSYLVEEQGRPIHIFYCLWEDRGNEQSFKTEHLTYGNRLAPVLAGRRNMGQRSLEIAVWGYEDSKQAEAAVIGQLEKVIRVQTADHGTTGLQDHGPRDYGTTGPEVEDRGSR